eukprot:4963921-Pyramimonas_sp.AAC.1
MDNCPDMSGYVRILPKYAPKTTSCIVALLEPYCSRYISEKLATKCGKHLKAIEKAKSQPARQGSEEKWLHCATQILPCMDFAIAYERCACLLSTEQHVGLPLLGWSM